MDSDLDQQAQAYRALGQTVSKLWRRIQALKKAHVRLEDLEIVLLVKMLFRSRILKADVQLRTDGEDEFGLCESLVQRTGSLLDEFHENCNRDQELVSNLNELAASASIQSRVKELHDDFRRCVTQLMKSTRKPTDSESSQGVQSSSVGLTERYEDLMGGLGKSVGRVHHSYDLEGTTSTVSMSQVTDELSRRTLGKDTLSSSTVTSSSIGSPVTNPTAAFEDAKTTNPIKFQVPEGVNDLKPRELSVDRSVSLGSGAYGRVYPGRWRNRPCAIKMLVPGLGEDVQRRFLSEAVTLAKLNAFSSFVKLYGVCIYGSEPMLVMKLMKQNLNEYLRSLRNRGETPPITQALEWSISIASGLRILHEQYQMCHRDLKSPNIFLTKKMKPRIGDFGLAIARRAPATEGTTTTVGTSRFEIEGSGGRVGTYRWMAPEVLTRKPYTTAADVYSFGVVMWELLTAGLPWEGAENDVDIGMRLERGERLPLPDSVPEVIRNLMLRMWSMVPSERPTFRVVCETLEACQARLFSRSPVSLPARMGEASRRFNAMHL